ncbi:cytochrome P450 [Actinoplanes sp. NPDC051861]|uniref:bifunctional cytochrome P450/NADPH--P450 reductase n=1 Tax=Actinoplanes sp. NPDC051861 TaxID=3155170 RepID=UPI003427AD73
MTAAIPAPRGLPIVGNGLQVPVEGTHRFFAELAAQHPGGVFKLNLAGRHVVFVHDPDLVAELCDESRFFKPVDGPLADVRDFAGDGLFTAREDEAVWGQAHRILLPAFSQRSMKAYFPQMLAVADDLVRAWEGRSEVDVSDDMTRLTLDTIALAGFGRSFRSFENPELHPFLQAMGNALTEVMHRARQLPVVTSLKKKADARYRSDISVMQETVDEVIRARRASGAKSNDLLGLMLGAADPVTGENLTDENIRNQVLTFLIAGHETTSGTLSFALHLLLRNPHVLARAYAEVDRMLPGDTVPTYETIMKLDVIPRILDETLRLLSPIPFIGLMSREDTTLGGRYPIPAGQKIGVLLKPLHTNPSAWPDPETFDIDRWLPERKVEHHPHAYKPFGNGERACIGRQFALTEARLALAMVLQRFAISDPDGHRLHIKQTLTIKPEDFRLRLRVRRPHERLAAVPEVPTAPATEAAEVQASGVRLTVAFGSNLGTSEDLAQQVADRGRRSGFDVTVRTLDELATDLPTEGLLVVVTSSYNGKAPDNAQLFDDLSIPAGALDGLRYAVLGNGNTQWATYQAYPQRVDLKLRQAGAEPVVARGETDASGDFDGMAQAWLDGLWTALAARYGTSAPPAGTGPRYAVEVLGDDQIRPAVVSDAAYPIMVYAVDELVSDPTDLWDFSHEAPRPGVKSITVRIPDGVTYAAGDHLAVYAKNDPELVDWALHTLRVSRDLVVRLTQDGDRPTGLPLGLPVTAGLLLTDFLELQEPASRAQISQLTGFTECPWTTRQLSGLITSYEDEVLAKRLSVLSLLERFPAIALPFGVYLSLVGTIKPRFYSISSSPSVDPSLVTITVGLVDGPSRTGSGRYRGMCSQYLARLQPGDVFYGHVRVPVPPFRAPSSNVPMILIGPGTGFAPLRGFLQERAMAESRGAALLFYGCRHPSHDWLYGDEMREWEAGGVVDLRVAFSAVPGHPWRYVQEAVAAAGDRIWELLEEGGHVYLCGDGARMAPAVRGELLGLYRRKTGGTAEQAEGWLRSLEGAGRYQQDVFA